MDPDLRDQADSRRAALVRLVLAQGREAFPAVSLADSTLAQCLLAQDEEVSPDVVTSHARDMFLAAACAAGDADALSILESGPLREIPAFVARIDTQPDFAAEVAQTVRQKLLVAPAPGQPAKIAEYRGAGPLGGWIRVIAVRVALDLKRAQSSPGSPTTIRSTSPLRAPIRRSPFYVTSTATPFATPCTPPSPSCRGARETCCAFTLRTG